MKIKGTIIIQVKFRGVRKLMILRCFIILHVQIMSGFENWDIQDLTLRRYDTIRSKNKKYYKNWTKETIFVTFLVSFFMAFLAQKLIYTVNINLILCLAHFLNKIILLNLFILRVYAKRWPKCARISKQKPKSITQEGV